MDFAFDAQTELLRQRLLRFMAAHVMPASAAFEHALSAGRHDMAILDPLKEAAKAEGLWNLFLPALADDEPGTRLSNVQYAPLAEIMGRVPWSSEVFNCSAPDTGNMELLHLFGSERQRAEWLRPLLRGEIRSTIGITEPEVASSDPTNLRTTIRMDGDAYVVDGHKWFNTGALHPNARFMIVMGVTDPREEADRHRRHSMIIVPFDTAGVSVGRNLPIMHHYAAEGHCEIRLEQVRVPVANLIGSEGEGFRLAQARLGPGRVHHCMRSIGQCELALEMMTERLLQRRAFGRRLADFANLQDWVAEGRMEIEQARLYVLRAAWMMDRFGNKEARIDVAAIKVVVARLQTRIMDRAMQAFGAAGLTDDTPLAGFWSWGRALRFIDGPDEVHLRSIARAEFEKAAKRPQPSGGTQGNSPSPVGRDP